tara:strand:- start:46 stop:390 length:345 start_codon:yes stop_codon:yes gene_type:complete
MKQKIPSQYAQSAGLMTYEQAKKSIEEDLWNAMDLLQEIQEEIQCGDSEVIKKLITTFGGDENGNGYLFKCTTEYFVEQAGAIKQAIEHSKYETYGPESEEFELDWIHYEGGMQ